MSEKSLALPTETTSFGEAAKFHYIDKTKLIKKILDSGSKVTLFTRPPHFGKSLALDMLRCFFEKSSKDNTSLFCGMDIWKSKDTFRKHHGKYAVVFLKMKDVSGHDWGSFLTSFGLTLAKEYSRHAGLPDDPKIMDMDRDYYRRIAAGELSSDVELIQGLFMLTRMLFLHHGSRPIVLIDDYDSPIRTASAGGFLRDAITFLGSFFSCGLKDNPYLELAVLTGIQETADDSFLEGMNNMVTDTVLDTNYADCFGFTEDEIEEIAQHYGRKAKIREVQVWYGGYRFGDTDIYNPTSVAKYFNSCCIPEVHWEDNDPMLFKLPHTDMKCISSKFSTFLGNKQIDAAIDTRIVHQVTVSRPTTLWSSLVARGYLSVEKPLFDIGDSTVYSLRLPNKEMHHVLRSNTSFYPKA